jgi:hypothetical protein
MPITINGSGTVTGISAGGLPDDCITTADIAANAVTTAKLGSAEQSGLCKAWVNFDGTGTVAIRASFNVSSITDNGTGDYTVNFTTALVDANYCAVVGDGTGVTSTPGGVSMFVNTYTTSSVKWNIYLGTGRLDAAINNVAIFR